MEIITDADYKHAKCISENNGLQNLGQHHDQNLGQHHDLYVESDTLLLADILKVSETSAWKFMN